MKLTFPHMGNVYIAGKAFFEELGQEVIPPPRCSRKTLEMGTKYSQETICLPLKIMIGNFIESIERGADTILLTGSCGPCRFGYYSILEGNVLKDLGYDVDFIVLDPLREGWKPLKENVYKIFKAKNIKDVLLAGKTGWELIKKADYIIQLSNIQRAYAIDSYEVDSIIDDYYRKVEETFGEKSMMKLMDQTIEKLSKIKIKENYIPIKIGLIGEIYTVIEPFVNLEIERKLGHMGVLVEKSLTPTIWLEHHIKSYPFGSKTERLKYKLAKPYLKTLVGGHGRETVGSAIYYRNLGFDGAIQLLPLNCMPEIVAKSILSTVSRDLDFPIMTLILDEMTGEAGYLTRLEAFVDLLKRRKENSKYA
ncbi:acyl-CoA dehydratase activase-related protein [Tepidimicrobium xylanilyticum]|uniref:Predicted nucleotide-binding protein, sugar kinase/HSP70/actin superfamily n=1 Tax=Tepidimicrobium xylanilyticum TaxID=1123352 RepID=A0A1H2TZF8_9FIRM|nr:acyl-CoA dehydratase activase-related protein [Tepidimicrobium xylanilyticum]GMG98064.1 2-hydroxyglutaryl-CoA dehydratase [Tepidimicrobium xylanilyticum]SDW49345.1 Predicted nucleotide-binding protein, sugar kinase/HSP70/actin superfamily [Tepidimicrobium xylanilyticum]